MVLTLNIADKFSLADDAILTPLQSLPEAQRRLIPGDDDAYVLTRVRGRTSSKVIDANFANLVRKFQEPATIVDAVLAFSGDCRGDPEQMLEDAYPTLLSLIDAGFLLSSAMKSKRTRERELTPGEVWRNYTILRLVRGMEDTDIYQARTAAGRLVALKIGRSSASDGMGPAFEREAHILARLDGLCTPAYVAHDVSSEEPFIAMSWCAGVNSAQASARLRLLPQTESSAALLALCRNVARRYAYLHAQCIIHGDVHSQNVLVDEKNEVSLIDFGLSRAIAEPLSPYFNAPRGGAEHFFEPEYARAWCSDRASVPQATALGEQHIVAHLLYRLVVGKPFFDFSSERLQGMRELAAALPEPFANRGRAPWPDLEAVLFRALSPEPADRYPSLDSLADALDAVTLPPAGVLNQTTLPSARCHRVDFVEDLLERLHVDGPTFEKGFDHAPRCSVSFGAAGVAHFLHRMSIARNDSGLLAQAQLWIERAIADSTRFGHEAFYDATSLPPVVVGPISLYHTAAGLHVTRALIARSFGDLTNTEGATVAFMNCLQTGHPNLDLTLGRSGLLLGCALLLEANFFEFRALREAGDQLSASIWQEFMREDQNGIHRFTGIAHGWAGLLYAILVWSGVSKTPLPAEIASRLDALAGVAERTGPASLHWPRLLPFRNTSGPNSYLHGWCNGSAGQIFLWTDADRLLPGRGYLDLARACANDMIAGKEHVNQLCCGLPGQVYALFSLFRHTREERWKDAAQKIVETSLAMVVHDEERGGRPFRYSLYNGLLGIALMKSEANDPQWARMPLFEPEGWRT